MLDYTSHRRGCTTMVSHGREIDMEKINNAKFYESPYFDGSTYQQEAPAQGSKSKSKILPDSYSGKKGWMDKLSDGSGNSGQSSRGSANQSSRTVEGGMSKLNDHMLRSIHARANYFIPQPSEIVIEPLSIFDRHPLVRESCLWLTREPWSSSNYPYLLETRNCLKLDRVPPTVFSPSNKMILGEIFRAVPVGREITVDFREATHKGCVKMTARGALLARGTFLATENQLVTAIEIAPTDAILNYLQKIHDHTKIRETVIAQVMPRFLRDIEDPRTSDKRSEWRAAGLLFAAYLAQSRLLLPILDRGMTLYGIQKSDVEPYVPTAGEVSLPGAEHIGRLCPAFTTLYNNAFRPSASDSPKTRMIGVAIAYSGLLTFLAKCGAKSSQRLKKISDGFDGAAASASFNPVAGPIAATLSFIGKWLFQQLSLTEAAEAAARLVEEVCDTPNIYVSGDTPGQELLENYLDEAISK